MLISFDLMKRFENKLFVIKLLLKIIWFSITDANGHSITIEDED